MRTIQNSRSMFRFAAPVALFAGLMFAACSTDSDPTTTNVRYTGALSTLDSITDSSASALRWHLVVDAAEPQQLKGTCDYDAWLGDSSIADSDSTTGLYTNTQMNVEGITAEVLRTEGIDFYVYDQDSARGPFTHYRVDFECKN